MAKATGETLTAAIVQALKERLQRVRRTRGTKLSDDLLAIGRRCAALPIHDRRKPDEILGYDQHGLPD